jgi:hypothetical protein
MRDRKVLTVEEKRARRNAQKAAESLTRRAGIPSRSKLWCDNPE